MIGYSHSRGRQQGSPVEPLCNLQTCGRPPRSPVQRHRRTLCPGQETADQLLQGQGVCVLRKGCGDEYSLMLEHLTAVLEVVGSYRVG